MVLDGFPFHVSIRRGIYDLSRYRTDTFANRWLNIVTTGVELERTRATVQTTQTRILKKSGPEFFRGLALEGTFPSKRMSIFAAAFRSSHVIGAGTGIVLIRWIRRAAFVGPAARARPCGHAFFMLRFLARGSAGTDVSFIGRAGRGLVLSRRNKRRAEERRNDKSRDCKFGSHQKCLRRLQDHSKPRAGI
jgi:hypothetical protein